MWWIFLSVGLAAAGLAVLAFFAARVFTAVRELAAQVAASGEALAAAGTGCSGPRRRWRGGRARSPAAEPAAQPQVRVR
ncbi:hypothetical protein [Actinacidiphila bryophytorum]|uniref:hypothetical protein n=1 Tax=Actinacidiphila bryophytorum TaxID=1436133 RepID=UPI002176BC5C|nr:hypothetical protein [Actinacidiphila bryophytorum]UWE09301.1 hypothetical protein NYE86_11580 [Actinacidiphila bryophytorum]